MTKRQPIVALDGPAGSGKSTVAQLTAQQAGLQFISSGALYRALALITLREGMAADDAFSLAEFARTMPLHFSTDNYGVVHTCLGDEDVSEAIRAPEIARLASRIATLPAVRAELVHKLQDYGQQGGIIMEGRDIQTVVFPDADIQIFLTASAQERARRRQQELVRLGTNISEAEVLQEVIDRDRQDSERDASPLCAAPNAITINTDGCSIAQVVAQICELITAWRAHPHLRGKALASLVENSAERCS